MDLLEPFVQACPIRAYCKGCGFLLHLYYRSHVGCTLPKCLTGTFTRGGLRCDSGTLARSTPREASLRRRRLAAFWRSRTPFSYAYEKAKELRS